MKVILPRGIASISGTISRSADKKLVAKTFRKADGTKETRMYWFNTQKRTTPPSDKEVTNRTRFAEASLFYRDMTPEDRLRYARAMKKENYRFNGKKYATLRGYVIARCFQNALL